MMSNANGQALVGNRVFYFEYGGTADLCCTRLHETHESMHEHWRKDNEHECLCGGTGEPARLSTDYGNGYSWNGRVCLPCMAITGGLMPFDIDDDEAALEDGEPSWWKEPKEE